jgi:two-component system CheB/CheR fusion protein
MRNRPGGEAATLEELLAERKELLERLADAVEALRALRAGEVDAVVVEADQERIYVLEAPEQPYRLLVEQMPHAAATLTVDGRIIHGNRRFAVLLERPLHELLGKPLSAFVHAGSRAALEGLLLEGCKADVQGEVSLERPGGTAAPVFLGISALKEGAFGTCLMVTDLTEARHYQELQRTQEALRVAGERLELAQQAGRIGTFEWDLRTGAMTWSATAEELYGGSPGTSYADWMRAIHRDDREEAESATRSAAREGTGLNAEFRIVRPDGETRWLAMRGKVYRSQDGETLLMVGVNLDTTERRRTEEALRTADRRKDEFLATLAHELRNPLAPIRNAVEILKVEGSSVADLRWSQGVLDRQVQVMSRLLDDLLDVSRISRNRLDLRKERVELKAVLDAALETSRPVIEAAGHKLSLSLPAGPVHLDADPVRLAQVFANLLNNAAKYTEDGGQTWIEARRQGDTVTVSVRDSGIGMSDSMLPHIFEIFSQAETALVRSQGGLGIGLSLVKGIVELHGGTIEARSEGPGRGSEFIVRLPVAAPEAARARQRSDAAGEPAPLTGIRILVVDDNRDNAETLAMVLKVMGNEVSTAYDGQQALEVARAWRPHVVLLDIGMPKMNGYEACRRMRSEPWGEGMCLVALTGWGQEEDRRRTEEAGFDHHLVKPVDPAALLKLLAATQRS